MFTGSEKASVEFKPGSGKLVLQDHIIRYRKYSVTLTCMLINEGSHIGTVICLRAVVVEEMCM